MYSINKWVSNVHRVRSSHYVHVNINTDNGRAKYSRHRVCGDFSVHCLLLPWHLAFNSALNALYFLWLPLWITSQHSDFQACVLSWCHLTVYSAGGSVQQTVILYRDTQLSATKEIVIKSSANRNPFPFYLVLSPTAFSVNVCGSLSRKP